MELQQIQSHLAQFSRSLTEKPMDKNEPFWGRDGFDFSDILDIVNPLQHLPVISKLYREQTDDVASEGSRLFGGLVFGGLMGGISGAVAALTNAAVRHETQQDIGDYLITEATSAKPKDTRSLASGIDEENPFFAELLELERGSQGYLEYAPDAELAEQKNQQRITQWGKV